MEIAAMEGIASRLAAKNGLYFPGSIRRNSPDASQRKSELFDLLSRDAPIFLERYGSNLSPEELDAFGVLISDYEVSWHVDRLRQSLIPTEKDSLKKSASVRNRRRAYMDRLIHGGDYFTEDSMREREPYLYHEYVGRFQDPTARVLSRPGEKWSEMLMRQYDEAMLVEKIRCEQERLGVARKDWIGCDQGMDDEESEEDDEDDEGDNEMNDKAPEPDTNANRHESVDLEKSQFSSEEMQDQLDQFRYVMQEKFLTGKDPHLDYSTIDNDEGLDDHWIKEANHDAEEKYFDGD